jgi:hypothetical protein
MSGATLTGPHQAAAGHRTMVVDPAAHEEVPC